jgi:hypothetical protein
LAIRSVATRSRSPHFGPGSTRHPHWSRYRSRNSGETHEPAFGHFIRVMVSKSGNNTKRARLRKTFSDFYPRSIAIRCMFFGASMTWARESTRVVIMPKVAREPRTCRFLGLQFARESEIVAVFHGREIAARELALAVAGPPRVPPPSISIIRRATNCTISRRKPPSVPSQQAQ